MSRLDAFIRRLEAQRACLGAAAAMVEDLPGVALELGLGNGRTFDHLRELMPGREIFVFERSPMAHPASTPDERHLIVGDLEDSLPAAGPLLVGEGAALIHSDIGTGDEARNARVAAWLALVLPGLLRPGGVLVSDQAIPASPGTLDPVALPAGVLDERYFIYRRPATMRS